MKIRNSEGYMDVVAYKAIMNVDREKKAETKSCLLYTSCKEYNRKQLLILGYDQQEIC